MAEVREEIADWARRRPLIFGLALAMMVLPGAVTVVPTYLIWNQVGLAHWRT